MNRSDRRHPDGFPAVPTSRAGTWGFVGMVNGAVMPGSEPRDMKPREVDRGKIKQARKTSRRNRRKR